MLPKITVVILLCIAMSATAQAPPACQSEVLENPPRVLYRCANGLMLEAEAGAILGLQQEAGQARPMVSIAGKAIAIEVEPNSGPFQILTPHAIAAVRGTSYIVDVAGDKTSVFVISGDVAVSRLDASQEVTLESGEGVDVLPGQPMAVLSWGQQRVNNLLARFAR
ncbi:FecR protein [Rhizobium sp. PDO1-076]|uniref:FecR family protein n=1 Tax=Rhizobium sp. PDO1-076 TaxID=1125979 RepID=UPI00024E3E46|nr:FecR family protein [Rhizobium sp. PDO1-076]EHS52557.1 FecR protein [Rhizobium sp. PDO1-076]